MDMIDTDYFHILCCNYFLKFIFNKQLLYNAVLVSLVQQCESALSIHLSSLEGPSHPLQLLWLHIYIRGAEVFGLCIPFHSEQLLGTPKRQSW